MPRPEVKWFKDGKEITPDEHTKIESLPDGTNRLIVDSARVDDQGNYRCEATNAAGSMSSKAPMTLNGMRSMLNSVYRGGNLNVSFVCLR